ncbi:hypothetical protein [Deinococcus multiflagellatus]|uniref:Uncharacterized protein n=1 Tax=Deinococcus multiflagellatus TaxID=1656887 RepID=A0ABW1ZQT0_9DEIO
MTGHLSPDHDQTRRLLRALRDYDLDTLLGALGPPSGHPRAAALRYVRLLPFFSRPGARAWTCSGLPRSFTTGPLGCRSVRMARRSSPTRPAPA